MKKSFIFLQFLLSAICLFAQNGPLKKGAFKISTGIGLGSYIKLAGGTTTFPPLTVSAEYAIDETITVGPVIGYTSTEDRYSYASLGSYDTYKLSNLLIGAKANYYFDVSPKYELYAGGMLGYDILSSSLVSKSSSSNIFEYNYSTDLGGFIYGVQAGARYKFTRNFAAFAELGYGIAVLTAGISFSPGKK